MQLNPNWYCKQQPLQQNIIISTHTILHPRLDVVGILDVQDILRIFVTGFKKKSIQRQTIFLTDADYDYTLDEI